MIKLRPDALSPQQYWRKGVEHNVRFTMLYHMLLGHSGSILFATSGADMGTLSWWCTIAESMNLFMILVICLSLQTHAKDTPPPLSFFIKGGGGRRRRKSKRMRREEGRE